jgi:hypothetical protein
VPLAWCGVVCRFLGLGVGVCALGQVAWFENDGATPPGWTIHVITVPVPADGSRSVAIGDVDMDGFPDICGTVHHLVCLVGGRHRETQRLPCMPWAWGPSHPPLSPPTPVSLV